jgi:hypothetical protein
VRGNEQLCQWGSNSMDRTLSTGEFVNGKYVPDTAVVISAAFRMPRGSGNDLDTVVWRLRTRPHRAGEQPGPDHHQQPDYSIARPCTVLIG